MQEALSTYKKLTSSLSSFLKYPKDMHASYFECFRYAQIAIRTNIDTIKS